MKYKGRRQNDFNVHAEVLAATALAAALVGVVFWRAFGAAPRVKGGAAP
jgi:hypothetical protein